MFGWFWEFLYMLSKTLFRLTDGLVLCANKLCGIDPVSFEGEETNLLDYLLSSDQVGFGFKAAALLATILVVVFTVFMILRSIGKDKAEGTPTQLSIKAFKTLLTFFFVPGIVIAFITVGNIFLTALYDATMQAASSPGAFLFCAFAEDGGMSAEALELFRTGTYDYTDTDLVQRYMELSDFPFLFSWLTGGVVMFGIGSSMLIFVDRVLSLVILYIVSPISISSSVLDDGSRFKLWRDQFLTKFITGYGMLIAVNVYALVCGLVMKSDFVFFPDSSFLDLLMKLLVIAGGGLTLTKSTALIGNLVASGAGSNELRDNAFSAGGLARMAGKVAGGVLGNTVGLPFKAGKSILSDALSMKSRDLGSKLLSAVGLGLSENTSDKDGVKDPNGKGAGNSGKAKYGDGDKAKGAIGGDKFKLSWNGGDNKNGNNANNNDPNSKKNDALNNALGNGNNGGGQQQQQQPAQGGGDQK